MCECACISVLRFKWRYNASCLQPRERNTGYTGQSYCFLDRTFAGPITQWCQADRNTRCDQPTLVLLCRLPNSGCIFKSFPISAVTLRVFRRLLKSPPSNLQLLILVQSFSEYCCSVQQTQPARHLFVWDEGRRKNCAPCSSLQPWVLGWGTAWLGLDRPYPLWLYYLFTDVPYENYYTFIFLISTLLV